MRLGRSWSICLLVVAMLAVTVAGSPAAGAQEGGAGDAFCALLTVDEVAAALGDEVATQPNLTGCSWASTDAEGNFVFFSAYWDSLPYDERLAATSGTPLTVAGRPAYFSESLSVLWIDLDQGVLTFQLGTSSVTDEQAAIEGLAALAVPRAASLPAPPPPPTQAPVPHADPGLEALFPSTIGGQPLTMSSMAGSAIFSSDNEGTAAFLAALTANGKTMDDVSIATGYNADYSSGLIAIRIAGGDATVFGPLLLATMDPESTQAPAQVAGKDVTAVTTGTTVQYVYPKDDVVWAVTATEPALSEIFAALP